MSCCRGRVTRRPRTAGQRRAAAGDARASPAPTPVRRTSPKGCPFDLHSPPIAVDEGPIQNQHAQSTRAPRKEPGTHLVWPSSCLNEPDHLSDRATKRSLDRTRWLCPTLGKKARSCRKRCSHHPSHGTVRSPLRLIKQSLVNVVPVITHLRNASAMIRIAATDRPSFR